MRHKTSGIFFSLQNIFTFGDDNKPNIYSRVILQYDHKKYIRILWCLIT
jgi:hypothetical protein